MATYNQKFNKDDSVLRHIIIGFLADINNKVYFHRQIDADYRIAVDVPFYYSITGDDQFLRDQLLFSTASGPDCSPDKAFADANYDSVPRGVATLSSMSIDSSKLVNKRTVGSYTKMNAEGAMEGYAAEFNMIPIVMSFDIEIVVSSTLDSFKITEAIIKRLYKSNYFNIEVGHLEEGSYRIASYYALPDDYTTENPLGFTFDDKEEYKITFPVEVNSFIPSFEIGETGEYGDSPYYGDANSPGSFPDSGTGSGSGTGTGTGSGTGSGIAFDDEVTGSSKDGTLRIPSVRKLNSTERHLGNRMFELTSRLKDETSGQEDNETINNEDGNK